MFNRSSIPPYMNSHLQSYTASPLQREMTPPPQTATTDPNVDLIPFPSVESSIDSSLSAISGANFHIPSQGLSDSSPTSSHPVAIYCAGCQRVSALKKSYACTECICGLCQECVDALGMEQRRGRGARCPRCGALGGRFKPFMLDIR